MINFFIMGGAYMWLLLILILVVFGLFIKKVIDLFFSDRADIDRSEKGVNAIFFWGAFSLLLGILAHFHGVFEAMVAISKATDISPSIVAMGYARSLITILSGLFIFMISGIMWFFLRWRIKNVKAA